MVSLEESNVTSVESLRSYSAESIVQLPDFEEGQPLIVKVKRVSMLALAKLGKIPNALLSQAMELFKGGATQKSKNDASNPLADMYDLCRIMAETCLVSPSLAEIEEAGLQLTDPQLVAIFNFTQKGVKALEPFRKKQENPDSAGNVQLLEGAPQ